VRFTFFCFIFFIIISDASFRRVSGDVEPKSCEAQRADLEATVTTRQQEIESTADDEVQTHRHEDERMSTHTGHYDEIVELEGPEELQPTSRNDDVQHVEQETASEYAGLNPVAVAEERARPPPVYEGLARR